MGAIRVHEFISLDGVIDAPTPLTRGAGPRLFPDGAAAQKLALTASAAYDNGVVYLAYRPQA